MRTKKLTFEEVIEIMDKMQTIINPLIELAKQKQQSQLPKLENGTSIGLSQKIAKLEEQNKKIAEEIAQLRKQNEFVLDLKRYA